MGFGSRGTKAHMAQLEARAGAISPKSSSLGEGRTRRRSEVRLHLAPQATGALPGRDLGRPRLGARAAAATTFQDDRRQQERHVFAGCKCHAQLQRVRLLRPPRREHAAPPAVQEHLPRGTQDCELRQGSPCRSQGGTEDGGGARRLTRGGRKREGLCSGTVWVHARGGPQA